MNILLTCLYVFDMCFIQAMSHAAAAQFATLIFVCVHREHYEFLKTLIPHLKGKVSVESVTSRYPKSKCYQEIMT